ncbi:MAG: hypothetical protein ACK5QC_13135 [Bacteroidota bacterium]|jgi:hypothetical protein
MLIQQTHFPQSGQNWGKVLLIGAGILTAGYIAYHLFKPVKLKIEPKTKAADRTE